MEEKDYRIEEEGDISIFVFEIKTITHDVHENLKEDTNKLFEQKRKKIILDFEESSYVSSLVLAALVYVQKRTQEEGGNLVFCNVSNRLKEIIATTNLDKIFDIVATREEAIAKFSKGK